MHARELIDLTAFLAGEGRTFLRSVRRLPEEAAAQYWTASKCRLERWRSTLRTSLAGTRWIDADWPAAQAVCEEILVSEILTRVWSALVTSLEAPSAVHDVQPVTMNVLAGHVDASNTVLNMLSDHRIPPRAAAELNRLRRISERWTDVLLGWLDVPQVDRFAHDRQRAEEFAVELAHAARPGQRQQTWNFLSVSLQASFADCWHGETRNRDLNSRVAGAIVACFPADLFDSAGVYHSLWMLRLSNTATDTQVLVEKLLTDRSNEAPFIQTGRGRRPA